MARQRAVTARLLESYHGPGLGTRGSETGGCRQPDFQQRYRRYYCRHYANAVISFFYSAGKRYRDRSSGRHRSGALVVEARIGLTRTN